MEEPSRALWDHPRMKLAPIARGSLLGVAAAVLFGMSTPLITHLGRGVGAFVTATLLYGGATIGAGLPMRNAAPVIRRPQLLRLAIVAVFGAVLAPASLAWGLQHTGALSASLLLNLEAVFTVFLARAIYREAIGSRVALAVGLMVAGGALLAFLNQHGRRCQHAGHGCDPRREFRVGPRQHADATAGRFRPAHGGVRQGAARRGPVRRDRFGTRRAVAIPGQRAGASGLRCCRLRRQFAAVSRCPAHSRRCANRLTLRGGALRGRSAGVRAW